MKKIAILKSCATESLLIASDYAVHFLKLTTITAGLTSIALIGILIVAGRRHSTLVEYLG